jgi:alanine racemase
VTEWHPDARSEPRPPGSQVRAEAVIDLAAVRANIAALRSRIGPEVGLMAVVKADAYGHGLAPIARTAVAAGAVALGVATLDEAVQAGELGLGVPTLAWLWLPGEDLAPALRAGTQLAISSIDQLTALMAAGGSQVPVRIHLKVDTGLSRNGVPVAALPALLDRLVPAVRAGRLEVVGLMSHLASADVPGDRSVAEQTAAFRYAGELLAGHGISPRWRHLANTPGLLEHPDARFDLVRAGIGMYGITPVADPAGLRPVMTLRAWVALTKRVPAGTGVSYGLTFRAGRDTTLALVPVGYADGIPRHASNVAEVLIGGRRRRIAGRVAMDQFVVDCGDDDVRIGDRVLVFGPGDQGEPTTEEWATACGTIGYEIVTRIGPRVPRIYLA